MTHRVALVAVASDITESATKLNASVLVGIAQGIAIGRVDRGGGNSAAGNGGGRVLRRREASKGRSRDDDGGVEHG